MKRRLPLLIGLTVAAGLGAWWAWGSDDPDWWVVSATVASADDALAACGDQIDPSEVRFSRTSDLPPGTLSEGVEWRVDGRERADGVLVCLVEHGAVDGEVRRPSEPKSFERTDP